ncbi:MAG: hypothetical protein NTV86_00025 [Planctomycetota bacterium]|nr:hypothetical protein [Planctomycetota bacterium]
MADDLTDTIRQNAQGPASAEIDGVRMHQHPLPDQIAADRHLGNKAAGRNPARTLMRARIVPPGGV